MPRGILWGVAFQKWLSRSASTGISGGGGGGERQTRKATFLVKKKWLRAWKTKESSYFGK